MAKTFLQTAQKWSAGHVFPEKLERFCEHLTRTYPNAQWCVSFSQQESFSLEILNQQTEQFEQTDLSQLDIEIFLPHKSASASVLGEVFTDWEQTAQRAFDMAQRAQEDHWLEFPSHELFDTTVEASTHLARPSDVSATQLQEHLLKLESTALKLNTQGLLRSDGASLQGSYMRHAYCNSAGVRLLTPSTSFSQSLSLIAQNDFTQESDYISDRALNFEGLKPYESLAKLAVERTIAKLDKKKIPSGNYPVIFSPRCSVGLVRCLLKALSGRLQYLKSSYLVGALFEQILPSWASLWDEPRALDRERYALIDSDGLPTRNHQIISEGILQEYLLSYYSAKRLGLTPNGLASGLINMSLTTNASSIEELIALYPQCVVVDSVSGTGINIMHGDYSQGIEGFFYEKGVKVCAIEEATIACNLKELFLSLQAHASDFERPQGSRIGSLAFPSMAVSCQ